MIDVSPYIEKLEKLREYMSLKIDNMGYVLKVDLNALPPFSVEQLIEFAMEQNIFLYEPFNDRTSVRKKLSFEEWLRFQPDYKECLSEEWVITSRYLKQPDWTLS